MLLRRPAALAAPVLVAALAAAGCLPAREAARETPPAPNPMTLAPRPTEPAITAADLMTRLYGFADDSMQGRGTGTEGYARATRYLAAELARLGLEPAGDSGTYFQTVPYGVRTLAVQEPLRHRGLPFDAGHDVRFLVPADWRPRDFGGGLVIFGGADARGIRGSVLSRTVVVLDPAGGDWPALGPDGALGRASLVLVVHEGELPEAQRRQFADSAVGYPPDDAREGPMVATITRRAAERLFGRPLAGIRPGTEIAGAPLNGLVLNALAQRPSHNVVAVLRGRDPALRGEYVALGAHADHVGLRRGGAVDHDSLRAVNAQAWALQGRRTGAPRLTIEQRQAIAVNLDSLRALRPARPDSIHNGADDDGSGSMALLEIAERLATDSAGPRRSVLFVWHAGEERGLRGSRWFTEQPTVPLDSIVAQVNIDMIGRGGAADLRDGGPDYLALVGSRRLSLELGALVDSVNAASTAPLRLDYALDAAGHPENIYCRSDHYSYARFGVPVVFLFTGLHEDYHQVTDEPQYVDYPHYARITRFAGDVVRTLADRERRPTVDGPRMDPNGRCRQ